MSSPGEGGKLTELKLTPLKRAPYRCPEEAKGAWEYLKSAHSSVAGLFATLHLLRTTAAQASDPRGRLSHQQTDQLRAAIVFTSSGLDACLRRLLRDALRSLIDGNPAAEERYRAFVHERLNGKPSAALRKAITGSDPRSELIDLYVDHVTGSSLQRPGDLTNVRDALGIPAAEIPDNSIEELHAFFAARNEITHELDIVDTSRPGISRRRDRAMALVRDQCDTVFQHLETFMRSTATKVTAAKGASRPA